MNRDSADAAKASIELAISSRNKIPFVLNLVSHIKKGMHQSPE